MRSIMVMPALRLTGRDLRLVKSAVDAVLDHKPQELLITGLVADKSPGCECEPERRWCVPSCEVLERLRELVVEPVLGRRSVSIAFVGLLDGVRGKCDGRTSGFSLWLDRSDVRPVPALYRVERGWCVLGRLRQRCLTRGFAPGATAVGLAKRRRVSVVLGDSGRLGIGRIRLVEDGNRTQRTLVGVEAGSLMVDTESGVVDRRRRSDIGVAVLTVDGRGRVKPRCVEF